MLFLKCSVIFSSSSIIIVIFITSLRPTPRFCTLTHTVLNQTHQTVSQWQTLPFQMPSSNYPSCYWILRLLSISDVGKLKGAEAFRVEEQSVPTLL